MTIVIAGAGPVGLMLAAQFAADPRAEALEIIIVDPRTRPVWERREFDLRVYALSRASQRMLERVGAWERIVECRVSPYRRMQIWEGDDPHGFAVVFDAADIGEPDLGHIVEDRLLRHVLTDVLETSRDIRFVRAGIDRIEARSGRVLIGTTAGERIAADLLVGADGSNSRVRRALGFDTVECDYEQHAVVAHVGSTRSHEDTAWQRFLPGGPVALLPLDDCMSSVVWSVPAADAHRLLALDETSFCAELEQASAGVLGKIVSSTKRVAFPLKALHVTAYCSQSVALIGDAAHVVHPLAGQGMNLGFLDATCLADVVCRAIEQDQYPGDRAVLKRYARQRKGHNLSMQVSFDALNRLFRLDWPRPLRAAGMSLLDRFQPGKDFLVRQAFGELVGE